LGPLSYCSQFDHVSTDAFYINVNQVNSASDRKIIGYCQIPGQIISARPFE